MADPQTTVWTARSPDPIRPRFGRAAAEPAFAGYLRTIVRTE